VSVFAVSAQTRPLVGQILLDLTHTQYEISLTVVGHKRCLDCVALRAAEVSFVRAFQVSVFGCKCLMSHPVQESEETSSSPNWREQSSWHGFGY
jgi:hypothetical protein